MFFIPDRSDLIKIENNNLKWPLCSHTVQCQTGTFSNIVLYFGFKIATTQLHSSRYDLETIETI